MAKMNVHYPSSHLDKSLAPKRDLTEMAAPLDQNDPIVQRINRYGPYGYVPELAPAVVFVVGE